MGKGKSRKRRRGAEINLERRRSRLEDGVGGGTAAAVAFSSCVVVYAERPPSSSSPCGVYLVCVALLSLSLQLLLALSAYRMREKREREPFFVSLLPPPLSDSQGRLGGGGRAPTHIRESRRKASLPAYSLPLLHLKGRVWGEYTSRRNCTVEGKAYTGTCKTLYRLSTLYITVLYFFFWGGIAMM